MAQCCITVIDDVSDDKVKQSRDYGLIAIIENKFVIVRAVFRSLSYLTVLNIEYLVR